MSETSPIAEQANPETELARDCCSPEDLPHDSFQTVPRTEPVVQVLEQINAELEKLSGKYPPCHHCNKEGHPPFKCWRRPDAKCAKCNQLGHEAVICKGKNQQQQQESAAQIAEEEDEDQLFVATCFGQGRKRTEMARLKSGWTLLLTNLILEIASAVFDQLGYAVIGMVLAFVALLLATAELLIHMPRNERMILLPSFHCPSTSTLAPGKPVGTIVEYFGLVGAVWQCFYSTVEYAYPRQKKDNPIKICLLPFIFLSCVVISKLIKESYVDKSA
ncbi:hypothetical protein SADUNF_Sadunf19G0008600 [Salix dunnii]|uniref:CCHC-type domain-containing protein n=1 Tax=Salix dunnii TaxID=1413687 RepID=A0A835J363_9ROSI|nr:hypothetical protein SADUNF_Sadunf19G0008600 [Salix dunnii]